MVTDKDNEQDRMIRENGERIARNEEVIKRQTEALEKIRDHYYPPPKRAWRKVLGFCAKACCAVFAYLGIAETVDWIWNARESGARAEKFASIARRLFSEEGDATSAKVCLEKAVKLDPKESEYVMKLTFMKGMAMADDFLDVERPLSDDEQARVDAALGEAIVLRELEPDDPMPNVLMAQALIFSGEKEDAVRAIECAVACAPDRVYVRVSACAILFRAGRYEEARRQLAEAERLDAKLPIIQTWKGLIALSLDHDAATARTCFAEVVRQRPRVPVVHVLLGRAILAAEKPDFAAARAEFQRALVLDAKRESAKMGMAEICEREGNLLVARLWLDRALASDAKLQPAFVARARVNLKLGEARSAVDDLTAAIALGPFRADVYRLRAEARAKAGDADGARKDRAIADALQPATPSAGPKPVPAVGRFAFDVPHAACGADDAVSVSHFLAAPAGRSGCVRATGERFGTDAGELRMFGVNFTGSACQPSHAEADAEAARLARLGVNCVRFHYMDVDPIDWDRFDYVTAALKRRGIYWNFNLHVAHKLGPADGMPTNAPPNGKVVTIFHPAYRTWLKDYARTLLRHANPYTGTAYADDPALAMVEIDNEDSLVVPWLMGDRDHWLGCLETMEKPYRDELTRQWNAWRAKRGLGPQSDFPARAKCPAEDLPRAAEFLANADADFYGAMRGYLRDELGVRCPVSGTQMWYATPQTLARLDYVDNHRYWRHPQWGGKPESWTLPLFTGGDPLVNSLETVIALVNERVAGKPYTVSEYNHPYPNPFGAEAMPLLCTAAAVEGWGGVFHYSYSHRPSPSVFDSIDRTDMLAHYPACSALFVRGDLMRSGHAAQARQDEKAMLEAMLGWKSVQFDFNAFRPGFTETPAWLKGTGPVAWNRDVAGKAYVTVDVPNVKLFTGFPEGRTVTFANGIRLAVGKTASGWATVSLVSRFGKAFAAGDSVLVAATASGAYTDEEIVTDSWGRKGFPDPVLGVKKRGTLPYCCEGVPFALSLPKEMAGRSCRALGPDGRATAEVAKRTNADGSVTFAFTPAFKTVWYSLF